MGLIWFMGFIYSLLLSTALSSTHTFQFQEQNHSHTHLNIFHSINPSMKDLLTQDQNRVNSLQSKLTTQESLYSTDIPLKPGYSIGSGNYYVKVGLGSPAKYYPMLMDTGSSLSWLQCQPCKIYCHTQSGPVYDPAGSSTYSTVPCSAAECAATKRATLNDPGCTADKASCVYTASYGDSSFSIGYLSRDRLILSPAQVISNFVYGCGQDNQGLYGFSAGMIGLARDDLSLLSQASGKYGLGFAYCLPSSNRGVGGSGGGGFLAVGKAALGSAAGYKFTPLVKERANPSLYFLSFVGVGVGAKEFVVPPSARTIIDSGTVITRLPRPVYAWLKAAFEAAVAGKLEKAPAFSILDSCFKGGASTARAVPEVRLKFGGGTQLVLGAGNVLIEADKGVVCLAFAATDSIAIIGNWQQQRYRVAYDVANSRIGFAPGGCT